MVDALKQFDKNLQIFQTTCEQEVSKLISNELTTVLSLHDVSKFSTACQNKQFPYFFLGKMTFFITISSNIFTIQDRSQIPNLQLSINCISSTDDDWQFNVRAEYSLLSLDPRNETKSIADFKFKRSSTNMNDNEQRFPQHFELPIVLDNKYGYTQNDICHFRIHLVLYNATVCD